jgi:hypothetical protein
MGFLDDIKKGADNLSTSINSSVSDTQTKNRVTSLLRDLGSLTWAARTGQSDPTDADEQARIEAELADIVATKGALDLGLRTGAPPPPAPPAPPAGAAPAPPAPPASAAAPASAADAPAPPAPPAPPVAAPAPPAPPAPAPPAPAPPAPAAPATAEPAPESSFTLDDL